MDTFLVPGSEAGHRPRATHTSSAFVTFSSSASCVRMLRLLNSSLRETQVGGCSKPPGSSPKNSGTSMHWAPANNRIKWKIFSSLTESIFTRQNSSSGPSEQARFSRAGQESTRAVGGAFRRLLQPPSHFPSRCHCSPAAPGRAARTPHPAARPRAPGRPPALRTGCSRRGSGRPFTSPGLRSSAGARGRRRGPSCQSPRGARAARLRIRPPPRAGSAGFSGVGGGSGSRDNPGCAGEGGAQGVGGGTARGSGVCSDWGGGGWAVRAARGGGGRSVGC